jgi:hypothetical protein
MKGEPERPKVRFFNVSLINANVMSMPHFPQPQRLVGELIHSIESSLPSFAWVQFLFKRTNLSPTLIALKNSIQYSAATIKTPKISWITGTEHDRREIHGDWYGRSSERMKRIDAAVNMPHVLLAIQGMWVGDPEQLSLLPFKDCYDEHDRLGIFVYRSPRMLVELIERRMVEDVSSYFLSYTSSRLEPPSFLITQEEVPYYLHLPVARTPDFLKSIGEKTAFSPEVPSGEVEMEGTQPATAAAATIANSKVLRLTRVPEISEPLKEEDAERLAMLPSPVVRGFEVLFNGGVTQILLSSKTRRDMKEYLSVMNSVYGQLEVGEASDMPDFLKQVPAIAGLATGQPPPGSPPSSVR